MLTGNEGIISKAYQVTEINDKATAKEKLNLMLHELKIGALIEGQNLVEYIEGVGETSLINSGIECIVETNNDKITFRLRENGLEDFKVITNLNGEIMPLLSSVVSVGDFVDYDAGTWIEGKALPTVQGEFGGYLAGTSRNDSITPYMEDANKYKGWRVLNIKNNQVYLIHAGTPEAYYHASGQSYNSEKILTGNLCQKTQTMGGNSDATPRDWSMYEDNVYSDRGKATVFTKDLLDDWNGSQVVYGTYITNDLIKTGSFYWFAQAYNGYNLYGMHGYGDVNSYYDNTFGIRPVIILKSDVKTRGQVQKNQSAIETEQIVSVLELEI